MQQRTDTIQPFQRHTLLSDKLNLGCISCRKSSFCTSFLANLSIFTVTSRDNRGNLGGSGDFGTASWHTGSMLVSRSNYVLFFSVTPANVRMKTKENNHLPLSRSISLSNSYTGTHAPQYCDCTNGT